MLAYSIEEERLNVASHALGAVFALVALVMMLINSTSVSQYVAATIYGASLLLMFLSSSFYHGVKSEQLKAHLKKLDHSAIYLLIAGTYTPFLLVTLGGQWAIYGMLTIWSLALFGVLFKLFTKKPRPRVSLATYLVMGWIALAFIYPLYKALPTPSLWLLVGGGVLYSVGTLFYSAKKRRYTHAIWHVFVVLACICHFLAIYGYVI